MSKVFISDEQRIKEMTFQQARDKFNKIFRSEFDSNLLPYMELLLAKLAILDKHLFIKRVISDVLKDVEKCLSLNPSNEDTEFKAKKIFQNISHYCKNIMQDSFYNGPELILRQACLHKLEGCLKLLLATDLDEKIDINKGNEFYDTPLCFSVGLGNPNTTELLINNGASVNYQQQSPSPYSWRRFSSGTALHSAVNHNNVAQVKILLKHNAIVDLKNYRGQTPLNLAILARNKTVGILQAALAEQKHNDCDKDMVNNNNNIPFLPSQNKRILPVTNNNNIDENDNCEPPAKKRKYN